jgi:hypothetical protein
VATTKPEAPATAQTAPGSVQTIPAGATPLALPAGMLAALAEEAKADAAKERPAISKISLKSGVMSYGGTPMPGNAVECIIVAAAFRNAYYAGRFDPNNIVNPNCFALAESDEGMVPHENVTEPENDTCKGCAKDEWNSDPNGGRGKACKQGRRLVLIPANALDEGDDKVKTAELAVLDLPVTSVKNYSQFVNTLSVTAGVPAWAAVCKISVVPDAKTQFKVLFQAMRVIPTMPLLDAVKSRRNDALRVALQPYDETATAESAAAAAASAGKGSKKF